MKLLVLAPQPFFQNRGTPIATHKMLNVLADSGHTIDLLTYHEGSPVKIPRCRHLRIWAIPGIHNIPPGFSLRKLVCDFLMAIQAVRLCWHNEYDVVHAVEESVFIALALKLFFGIPYIYDMDSSLPQQLQDKFPFLSPISRVLSYFEGVAVRGSRGVVAVCQALEDTATEHCDHVPIVRIEDASLITSNNPPASGALSTIDTEEMIDCQGRMIMYVGNLERYQGIDLLVHAFVHTYHKVPDAFLVVVGGAADDITHYQALVQRFQVADRSLFLGPRPLAQLGSLLRQAAILVSPRIQGTNTPMKIFSYMESGTPILATKLSMHTQVLDPKTALLVPPTPYDMYQGLIRLLDEPQLGQSLALNAKNRIQQNFSSQMLDNKLTDFYEELESNLIPRTTV